MVERDDGSSGAPASNRGRTVPVGAVGYLVAVAAAAAVSPFGPVTLSLPVLAGALVACAVVAVFLRYLGGRLTSQLAKVAVVTAGLLGFAWLMPAFQGLVYTVVVTNPGGFQWLLLSLLVAAPIFLTGRATAGDGFSVSGEAFEGTDIKFDGFETSFSGWGLLGVGILCLGLIGFVFVGPVLGNTYAAEGMADRVQASATAIDQPPESVAQRSRIVPQGVASNWVENSLQYPRYTASGGDITYIDGTPHWSYSLSPDGAVNTLTRKQRGAVYVNQSSIQKDILIHDDQEFRYGQGVAVTDSYRWQVATDSFLHDYREPFVVPHRNESYLVVPYVSHEWEFRATPVPQLYSVPQFGGVKIIDQSGNIETVPADQTQDHPVLAGQNYYPYSLARFKIKSMAYKNGILNTIVGHKGQIELADVPGDGNSQPFTIPTEEGPTYLLATEPWGKANGVFQIWTLDAQTGRMQYTQFDQQNALRGPRKAVESIMATPELSRLNDVQAVEPIPVVRDGTLYWQARIIPDSSARITYVAFFNADTEDVTVVETTGQVQAFLSGGSVQTNDTESPETGDETDGCGLQIVVEYPDGSTETMCVPEGSGVTVTEGTNRSTANATG
jgi:hypothetical protein